MFCTTCGHKLRAATKFCPRCGTAAVSVAPSGTPAPAVPSARPPPPAAALLGAAPSARAPSRQLNAGRGWGTRRVLGGLLLLSLGLCLPAVPFVVWFAMSRPLSLAADQVAQVAPVAPSSLPSLAVPTASAAPTASPVPAASAASMTSAIPLAPATNGELRVHVIDVGQGDSILIQAPDGTTALIDGGYDNGRTLAYLQAQGIGQIRLWWRATRTLTILAA